MCELYKQVHKLPNIMIFKPFLLIKINLQVTNQFVEDFINYIFTIFIWYLTVSFLVT